MQSAPRYPVINLNGEARGNEKSMFSIDPIGDSLPHRSIRAMVKNGLCGMVIHNGNLSLNG